MDFAAFEVIKSETGHDMPRPFNRDWNTVPRCFVFAAEALQCTRISWNPGFTGAL